MWHFFWFFLRVSDSFNASLLRHMAQMLAWHWLLSGENLLQKKTPLVVGETRTQVFADSMAIAASALNHCATYNNFSKTAGAVFVGVINTTGHMVYYGNGMSQLLTHSANGF